MNINDMGLAGSYENPTASGGATGWDLTTWITASMLFEGTRRGLFSLLFGVGMYILLDRPGKERCRDRCSQYLFPSYYVASSLRFDSWLLAFMAWRNII